MLFKEVIGFMGLNPEVKSTFYLSEAVSLMFYSHYFEHAYHIPSADKNFSNNALDVIELRFHKTKLLSSLFLVDVKVVREISLFTIEWCAQSNAYRTHERLRQIK